MIHIGKKLPHTAQYGCDIVVTNDTFLKLNTANDTKMPFVRLSRRFDKRGVERKCHFQ